MSLPIWSFTTQYFLLLVLPPDDKLVPIANAYLTLAVSGAMKVHRHRQNVTNPALPNYDAIKSFAEPYHLPPRRAIRSEQNVLSLIALKVLTGSDKRTGPRNLLALSL